MCGGSQGSSQGPFGTGGYGSFGTKPFSMGPEKSKPYSVNMTPPPPMNAQAPFMGNPEMSRPFSMNAPQMPPHSGFPPMSAPFGMNQPPQAPMDPRVAYQQKFGQQAQPLSGAYDYSPLSAQQTELNQQKAGTYPGAPPPPGYVAPPPGPFADWMDPTL